MWVAVGEKYKLGSEEKSKVSGGFLAYGVVLFQIFSRVFLCIPSNLSDEDDALRLWILQEHLQTVYEVCPIKRIPTNT